MGNARASFVHDLSPDNKLLPTPWQEPFEIALEGAFPALSRMREEGIIQGWGIGVNTPEPILRVMQEADPDVCLLAGFISGSPRYNYGKTPGTFPASTSRSDRGCALWRLSSAPIYEPLRFGSLRRRTSPRP